jgi:hypothetical protein
MPQPRKLHDRYFKQAKAEGYVARSAYKLLEINEGKRIVREHNRVIDLGCAPGSWLQVVENIIGPSGLAVGIDLQEVRPMFGPTITTIVGDAFTIDPALLLSHIRGKPADALISDMAPNTSGHGDDFLSARLCERVVCGRLALPLRAARDHGDGRGCERHARARPLVCAVVSVLGPSTALRRPLIAFHRVALLGPRLASAAG